MTASLQSPARAGRPFSLQRLLNVAGRILAVPLGLYLLIAVRGDEGFNEALIISVAIFVALYFACGRQAAFRQVVVYIIAMAGFVQLRSLADQTGIPTSFAYVIQMETALFGQVPTVWLQEHLYEFGRVTALDVYLALIYVSYFAAFQVAALVVWLKQRALFPVYATAVVLTAYIGLITCFVLPTAPPWLAAQEGDIPPVHRSVKEMLNKADTSVYNGGANVVGVNDVAAMPSLHMAMSVLVMLIIWRLSSRRWLRALSVLYALSMAFALVYLGEHYVVDEVFGVMAAACAWYLANRLWMQGEAWRWPALAWRTPASAAVPASSISSTD
jgi:membrane-associated phospholipid phosphatase